MQKLYHNMTYLLCFWAWKVRVVLTEPERALDEERLVCKVNVTLCSVCHWDQKFFNFFFLHNLLLNKLFLITAVAMRKSHSPNLQLPIVPDELPLCHLDLHTSTIGPEVCPFFWCTRWQASDYLHPTAYTLLRDSSCQSNLSLRKTGSMCMHCMSLVGTIAAWANYSTSLHIL